MLIKFEFSKFILRLEKINKKQLILIKFKF